MIKTQQTTGNVFCSQIKMHQCFRHCSLKFTTLVVASHSEFFVTSHVNVLCGDADFWCVYVCFFPTGLFTLKCQPAVGVIGQTTIISCSIETQTETKPSVKTVVITKIGQQKHCFAFNTFDKSASGDTRFRAENVPSLELQNTMISDEGEYKYFIRTYLGSVTTMFTINVTGKSQMSRCAHDLTAAETKLHLYFCHFLRLFVFLSSWPRDLLTEFFFCFS